MSNDKPKTVVPPTSGRGGPHPAEVNEHLALAHARCNKLIEAAEHRGDQAGADAWLVALRSIEDAEKAMRVAREKQTWRTMPGERVGSTLAARAAADSDPLGRTAERERRHAATEADYLALAQLASVWSKHGPNGSGERGPCDKSCLKCVAESVLTHYRNESVIDRHKACDQGTPGCRGRGEKHACISGVR